MSSDEYSHIPINQNSPYVAELVEFLQPYAHLKHVSARQRLNLDSGGVQLCYLILQGRITFQRFHDDLTIATVSAPSLVGLYGLTSNKVPGYLITQTPCQVGVISLRKANEVIEENNLWQTLSKHMMVVSGKLYTSSNQLTAPTAFDIVRIQLQELMKEAPEVRSNITAEKYIRNKTHLSRSGVLRILANLKTGGYIETHEGVLISINHIPEKY
ncbi:winged helix-turn-helix transcriptional regulator [Lelliottia aquatilis]|uniref:winged helix-turn-helix transcriptional regulator n=1 Tax=Lelliottia aquatilis TaxID=2080838 RepID=UPI00192CCAA8|nr:winged helix-turn-helix transcriptional regulator [Lelliottia aquatilis]MBL5886371.1 helix-turn-helix domain-containing protein [Lelliottia aquatilis]